MELEATGLAEETKHGVEAGESEALALLLCAPLCVNE
jgi:hypothetical protein